MITVNKTPKNANENLDRIRANKELFVSMSVRLGKLRYLTLFVKEHLLSARLGLLAVPEGPIRESK